MSYSTSEAVGREENIKKLPIQASDLQHLYVRSVQEVRKPYCVHALPLEEDFVARRHAEAAFHQQEKDCNRKTASTASRF